VPFLWMLLILAGRLRECGIVIERKPTRCRAVSFERVDGRTPTRGTAYAIFDCNAPEAVKLQLVKPLLASRDDLGGSRSIGVMNWMAKAARFQNEAPRASCSCSQPHLFHPTHSL